MTIDTPADHERHPAERVSSNQDDAAAGTPSTLETPETSLYHEEEPPEVVRVGDPLPGTTRHENGTPLQSTAADQAADTVIQPFHASQKPGSRKPRWGLRAAVGGGVVGLLAAGAAFIPRGGDNADKPSPAPTTAAAPAPANTATTLAPAPEAPPTPVTTSPEIQLPDSDDPKQVVQALYDNLTAAFNTNNPKYLAYYCVSMDSPLCRQIVKDMQDAANYKAEYPNLTYSPVVLSDITPSGFDNPYAAQRTVRLHTVSTVIYERNGALVSSKDFNTVDTLTLIRVERTIVDPDGGKKVVRVWLIKDKN